MSGGVTPDQTRASGAAASAEEAREETENLTEPIEEEILDEERRAVFRTPGFSRMKTEWSGRDLPVIRRAQHLVEEMVLENFGDAYQVMYDLYDVVREPEISDETGEVRTDEHGWTIWKKTPSGNYVEDWSRLTHKQRQHFLFTITTRIFEWEQRAADAWGESMFAKAQFEERFAAAFEEPDGRATVDFRRAHANTQATDERYFAILMTLYSRKAESVVRTLGLLAQRIKDTMAQ